MNHVERLILTHLQMYPVMQIQDVYKLIYQQEFAGGHLITDPSTSYDYLKKEVASINTSCLSRFEDIGNALCRINLHAIEADGITLDTLNRCFVYTSNTRKGSITSFEEKLALWVALCKNHVLPFVATEVSTFIEMYKLKGYPPVSHSEVYRKNYTPHYRVVDSRFKHYYEILCKIDHLYSSSGSATVAIDGNSGSGKSTLVSLLESIYDCNIFHMDDFFLAPELKTAERLSTPGGNVDYVRFREEVLLPLGERKPFSYQLFDCKQGKLADWIHVPVKSLTIIEGVYSLHPTLASFYDLKVFLYTDSATQVARIRQRNGDYMLERFKKEWIPLENHYFDALHIAATCDLVIDTSLY